MNQRSTPGIGQWLTVSLMVATALFLIIKLYQYAGSRGFYPAGLTVAGVNVGGMSPEQASELLSNRYLEAPISLQYEGEVFEIRPTDAEFTLDIQTMLLEADEQRTQLDFWSGFWGFLWGRPFELELVELGATHNRDALINELRRIASVVDAPAQPPQPVPGTLSFQSGSSGTRINIEASLDDVELALYRPSNRSAPLLIEPVSPERPEMDLLTRLLVNHLQEFEQQTGGVVSIFVMDLESGEELAVNANMPMSGMDLMRVPIVLEAYRNLERITPVQSRLISETLVTQPEFNSANTLLTLVAGEDDPHLGVDIMTASLQRLGLQNSFMIAPYESQPLAGKRPLETPANSIEGLRTAPDPNNQTTAEDIGTLLSMLYYCSKGQGGALLAVYSEQLSPEDCQDVIDFMSLNKIGSLIEEGVPPETAVAHRHGWISDTHGDAGIVYSPGGNYIIVQILYAPDWLEWATSSVLLAEISQATYNFFNFDNPYLGNSRIN